MAGLNNKAHITVSRIWLAATIICSFAVTDEQVNVCILQVVLIVL
jgi:hypothetical protein